MQPVLLGSTSSSGQAMPFARGVAENSGSTVGNVPAIVRRQLVGDGGALPVASSAGPGIGSSGKAPGR